MRKTNNLMTFPLLRNNCIVATPKEKHNTKRLDDQSVLMSPEDHPREPYPGFEK